MSTPIRIARVCGKPGCGKIVLSIYCPEHEREREQTRKTPFSKNMFNVGWDRFRARLLACGNVVCQRVHAGMRCRKDAIIFHHIIAADTRHDLVHHPENVVGVCRSCHPRPTDADQGQYLPTLWSAPMSGEPLPAILVERGCSVPSGIELWTVENRMKRFPVREWTAAINQYNSTTG